MNRIVQKILISLKRWLRPPRSLRVTSTGWKFLGLTTIVGLAAINTGNNLLYLLVGSMLSFITASGVLSEFMLRHVSLQRTFPKHIFARQTVPVRVAVKNRKKRIASFSLLIEDFTQENHADQRHFVLKIPAQTTETITYPVIFTQRGVHRPGKIRVSTRYPFGFFLKSANYVEVDDEELLVYPAIEKLQPGDLPHQSSYLGDERSPRQGRGSDVHSIRDYAPGDESTRIHWKSTAKFAKVMTKEFEEEQKKKIAVILDVSYASQTMPPTFYQDVEQAISLAASYIMHFLKSDLQLQLITPTQRSSFDRGQRHLFHLLRMLALLQPTNGYSQQSLTRSIRQLKRADVMKLLISVNEPDSLPRGGFAKVVTLNSRKR